MTCSHNATLRYMILGWKSIFSAGRSICNLPLSSCLEFFSLPKALPGHFLRAVFCPCKFHLTVNRSNVLTERMINRVQNKYFGTEILSFQMDSYEDSFSKSYENKFLLIRGFSARRWFFFHFFAVNSITAG